MIKNLNFNKKDVVFTLEQLKDFCKIGKVKKEKQHLFTDIFFDDCFFKIFEGAKSSGKTFSICAFFLYLLVNEENWNGIVIRKYASDHKTKTFTTFQKVAGILDKLYNCNLINNLSFNQFKSHTEIEYNKKIISFLSLSSTSNIGGITCPFGGYGGIFIDEIVEFKDTSFIEISKIQMEQDGLKMIIDTAIRGTEYDGKHKFLITASNGWNEEHWFTKEYVSSNLQLDYKNIEKLKKNNYLFYRNKKFDEGMGISILKITTWVNIHKSKDEIKKAKALKTKDINYYNASVLGLYYQFLGNSLIYGDCLQYVKELDLEYFEKNKKYIKWVIWSSDWGKNDATVLLCNLIIADNEYKNLEWIVYKNIELKNKDYRQQDKIKFFIDEIEKFYNEFPFLMNEINYYTIDNKEYTIIELIKDYLYNRNLGFIQVFPSIKSSSYWNIDNRISTVKMIMYDKKIYFNNGCLPLTNELSKAMYTENWERDEIHCKLDNINSLEYAVAMVYEYLIV